jgi:hypothetical protein
LPYADPPVIFTQGGGDVLSSLCRLNDYGHAGRSGEHLCEISGLEVCDVRECRRSPDRATSLGWSACLPEIADEAGLVCGDRPLVFTLREVKTTPPHSEIAHGAVRDTHRSRGDGGSGVHRGGFPRVHSAGLSSAAISLL